MDDEQFRRSHRQRLVEDRISGASQMARMALDSLAEYATSCSAGELTDLRDELLGFAEELQYARPNMAPIEHLVGRWGDQIAELDCTDADNLRTQAATIAERLADDSIHAVTAAAAAAARLIGAERTVLTHSYSSTVFESLRILSTAGVRAVVSESRPGLEGRLLAQQLDRARIATTFITDAQLGLACREADIALVGADTLLGDGAVVNKAGTYLLALGARDCGLPLYVCCESFKRVPYTRDAFELERNDPGELDAPRGRFITPRNVYFDITPAAWVTAWIDESGVTHNEAPAREA